MRPSGGAGQSPARSRVDDSAAAGLDHEFCNGAGAEERAAEVDAQDLFPQGYVRRTKSKQPYDKPEISFSAESAACAPSAAAVITWPVVPARTAPAAKMPRTEVSIVSLTVT